MACGTRRLWMVSILRREPDPARDRPTYEEAPRMALPPAPAPRRLSRPKWFNVRVVGGILLVIAAIVIGARVMAAGAQTAPVWAAERGLAAGTVIGAGDLTAVEVNLGDNSAAYLSPQSRSPVGMTLVAPLAAG